LGEGPILRHMVYLIFHTVLAVNRLAEMVQCTTFYVLILGRKGMYVASDYTKVRYRRVHNKLLLIGRHMA
jgi:hypothetical protein